MFSWLILHLITKFSNSRKLRYSTTCDVHSRSIKSRNIHATTTFWSWKFYFDHDNLVPRKEYGTTCKYNNTSSSTSSQGPSSSSSSSSCDLSSPINTLVSLTGNGIWTHVVLVEAFLLLVMIPTQSNKWRKILFDVTIIIVCHSLCPAIHLLLYQ